MKIAFYETNLTDAQWAYLKPLLPKPAKRGRPSVDRRRIIDAILYLVKCGCPWRYLPVDFPHWKTVYHVFRQWCRSNQRALLNDTLRILVRKTHGKRSRPTAAILDSQSPGEIRRNGVEWRALGGEGEGKQGICTFVDTTTAGNLVGS